MLGRDATEPYQRLDPAFLAGISRLKAFFAKKVVREINICLTVQKVSKIQTWTRQVHCVDLKIPPIERAIGRIVVIDLARTS